MSAADEVKALLGKLMPYILQSDVDGATWRHVTLSRRQF
jgi:hypothetical protein